MLTYAEAPSADSVKDLYSEIVSRRFDCKRPVAESSTFYDLRTKLEEMEAIGKPLRPFVAMLAQVNDATGRLKMQTIERKRIVREVIEVDGFITEAKKTTMVPYNVPVPVIATINGREYCPIVCGIANRREWLAYRRNGSRYNPPGKQGGKYYRPESFDDRLIATGWGEPINGLKRQNRLKILEESQATEPDTVSVFELSTADSIRISGTKSNPWPSDPTRKLRSHAYQRGGAGFGTIVQLALDYAIADGNFSAAMVCHCLLKAGTADIILPVRAPSASHPGNASPRGFLVYCPEAYVTLRKMTASELQTLVKPYMRQAIEDL